MDKRTRKIRKDAEKGEIRINKGMIFLPDDLKKLKKLRGKWLLYIKKGLLTRLDKKKKEKTRKQKN